MTHTRRQPWVLGLGLGFGLMAGVAQAGEVPAACQMDGHGQEASVSCYQDLDRNGDGALSQREALRLPRLRDGGFQRLDADGNGSLSPVEFQGELTTPPQRAGGKGT